MFQFWKCISNRLTKTKKWMKRLLVRWSKIKVKFYAKSQMHRISSITGWNCTFFGIQAWNQSKWNLWALKQMKAIFCPSVLLWIQRKKKLKLHKLTNAIHWHPPENWIGRKHYWHDSWSVESKWKQKIVNKSNDSNFNLLTKSVWYFY